MTRRLFTLAALLSLALCLATAVLWVRSYSAGDAIRREAREINPDGRHVAVTSLDCYHGLMHVERVRRECTQPWDGHAYRRFRPKWSWTSGGYSYGTPWEDPGVRSGQRIPSWWNRHGFEAYTHQEDDRPRYLEGVDALTLPFWAVAVLFLVLPSARLTRSLLALRTRCRSARGLCPGCGYDLRESVDRCPECGAAVEKATLRAPARRTDVFALTAIAAVLLLVIAFFVHRELRATMPYVLPGGMGTVAERQGQRVAHPGDTVRVVLQDVAGPNTATPRDAQVDSSGQLTLPPIDDPIPGAGRTERELEDMIAQEFLDRTDLSLSLTVTILPPPTSNTPQLGSSGASQ